MIERDGDFVPKEGGTNRFREMCTDLPIRVGDLPAAAGAESGVLSGFGMLSALGKEVILTVGVNACDFDPAGTTYVLYLDGFERETSSSKAARLRLLRLSKRFGSTFSESESSGEGARRLRAGAELRTIAEGSLACRHQW